MSDKQQSPFFRIPKPNPSGFVNLSICDIDRPAAANKKKGEDKFIRGRIKSVADGQSFFEEILEDMDVDTT